MYILGISAYYHDSAATLIADGKIIAAVQEERFTRIKNDESFPIHAIQFCLQEAGITIGEVAAVIFYEKPFLKFERILETYYEVAPRGFVSFIKAIPVWLKEKLFLRKRIKEHLSSLPGYDKKKLNILFAEHHLSHAASAFFPSGFENAAILTVDGVGEWATCTIAKGEGNTITTLRQLHFPHSIGLVYSAFTYFCGFKVNRDEYKLMGLAAYGNAGDVEYEKFKAIITEKLMRIAADGSVRLDLSYFSFTTSLRMIDDHKWQQLFGISKRNKEDAMSASYCNLALAVQHVTEECMLLLAKEAKRLTQTNTLCLAGGVALNCVANGKISKAGIFDKIFIQPASNDAGGALGAALAGYYIYFQNQRKSNGLTKDDMNASLLGPSYTNEDVLKAAARHQLIPEVMDEANLYTYVSNLLQQQKVIGWFQGRTEFGPRALGNRSILADPRPPGMQRIINEKVKFREGFRPFAPVILEEHLSEYFDISEDSPYMLLVAELKDTYRNAYPPEATSWGISEKLDYERSFVSSVTHVDYTARLQSVNEERNPKLFRLLSTFYATTGCPMLINTSFNTDNEPIVNSPEDAFRCFLQTNIDYLVIHNFVFTKK